MHAIKINMTYLVTTSKIKSKSSSVNINVEL